MSEFINENSTSAFNYWEDFNLLYTIFTLELLVLLPSCDCLMSHMYPDAKPSFQEC